MVTFAASSLLGRAAKGLPTTAAAREELFGNGIKGKAREKKPVYSTTNRCTRPAPFTTYKPAASPAGSSR